MQEFLNRIRNTKANTVKMMTQIKAEGKTIAGYGAPAKATTLLTYFGIADMIDFIADDSILKVDRYMPGSHIPIVSSDMIYEKQPDYLFIFAWNFAEPIMQKVREKGYKGEFILPFI